MNIKPEKVNESYVNQITTSKNLLPLFPNANFPRVGKHITLVLVPHSISFNAQIVVNRPLNIKQRGEKIYPPF